MRQLCTASGPVTRSEADVLSDGIQSFSAKVVDLSERLARLVEGVSFSVNKFIEKEEDNDSVHLVEAAFDGTMNEEEIREFLKDNHGTFPVFVQSMGYACDEVKKTGKKVSVALYLDDLRKDSFVPVLNDALSQGVNPNLISLQIHPDDHGIMDSRAIKNLRALKNLGFQFALHDFELRDDGAVDFTHTTKLIRERIIPNIVFVAKRTIEALGKKMVSGYRTVLDVLNGLRQQGVEILAKSSPLQINRYPQKDPIEDVALVNSANIEDEPMFDDHGTIRARELLVRFADGLSVPQGLNILKSEGKTLSLLKKVALHAIYDVKLGKRITVNGYIKDFSDSRFAQLISMINEELPPDMRKNLVFEVLEERYGAINNQFIKNIKYLKEHGYAIAVDDLHVDDDTDGMSKEILETFIEMGISPDYIKLDGKHMEDMRKGELSDMTIEHIRQIIGQFSKFEEQPTLIAEWIRDAEHARLITKTLGDHGLKTWWQGRDLKKLGAGEFYIGEVSFA